MLLFELFRLILVLIKLLWIFCSLIGIWTLANAAEKENNNLANVGNYVTK